MKNKFVPILLLLFLPSIICAAECLSITIEGEVYNYPPDVTFELYDAEGELVCTHETLKGSVIVETKHKLLIHYSWKSEADVFVFESGIIEMKEYSFHNREIKKEWDFTGKKGLNVRSGAGIKASKKISPSETLEGYYNLELNTTNGINFKYIDGKASASFEGEQLEIIGKYVVESPIGVLKVSFRPKTKEAWWVFHENKIDNEAE